MVYRDSSSLVGTETPLVTANPRASRLKLNWPWNSHSGFSGDRRWASSKDKVTRSVNTSPTHTEGSKLAKGCRVGVGLGTGVGVGVGVGAGVRVRMGVGSGKAHSATNDRCWSIVTLIGLEKRDRMPGASPDQLLNPRSHLANTKTSVPLG